MENATARSNPKSSGNSCQQEVGKSQHRPSGHANKARGGAHGLVQRQIQASALYQYRLPDDGRKWRVQCERRRRLAIYLAGYAACYPGLKRIARDLGWSRRTVAVVMAQLKRLGVMVPQGYVAEHGTRLRVLKPEALRSRSRESCTPASRESCTQELPKKFHLEKADTADTAAKTAAGSCPAPFKDENKEIASFEVKSKTTNTQEKASQSELDWSRPVDTPARKTNTQHTQHTTQSAFDTAVRIFRSSTWFKIAEPYATGLACFIASRSIRATCQHPRTVTYYTESAQNFFEQYSESQQNVLMLEGPDRYQAEIDGLNGRPAKKRPHRHLSAAERRSAKIEEVLERVFGSSRTEPSPEPEPSHELKPNVEPGETFEAYQARLDGYAAVRRDAEIGREKTRRRGGRCGPTAD